MRQPDARSLGAVAVDVDGAESAQPPARAHHHREVLVPQHLLVVAVELEGQDVVRVARDRRAAAPRDPGAEERVLVALSVDVVRRDGLDEQPRPAARRPAAGPGCGRRRAVCPMRLADLDGDRQRNEIRHASPTLGRRSAVGAARARRLLLPPRRSRPHRSPARTVVEPVARRHCSGPRSWLGGTGRRSADRPPRRCRGRARPIPSCRRGSSSRDEWCRSRARGIWPGASRFLS